MIRIKSVKRRIYQFHIYSDLGFKGQYRCKSCSNAISACEGHLKLHLQYLSGGAKSKIAPFVNFPNINNN